MKYYKRGPVYIVGVVYLLSETEVKSFLSLR